MSINLLPLSKNVTFSDLLGTFPHAKSIYACDFYIAGAELWEPIHGGWKIAESGVEIINIDHHAPHKSMQRFYSSGNLARDFVLHYGVVTPCEHMIICINHCDCDSIVSSGTLYGLVGGDSVFQQAVIAVDHTGEELHAADALQALEPLRDCTLSIATLKSLRDGAPLPLAAQRALEIRAKERVLVRQLLSEECVTFFGKVAMIFTTRRVSAEMLPALLPQAAVILLSISRVTELL